MAFLIGLLVAVGLVVGAVALFATGHTLLGFVALIAAAPFGVVAGLTRAERG